MKNIFIINGSASSQSSNQRMIDYLIKYNSSDLHFSVLADLKTLPHFDPDLATVNPPLSIVAIRKQIEQADGILICTPEYVFSIPSGLKNLLEWCVATTLLSDKPAALIAASANGEKGHAELQLIMETLGAKLSPATNLLIQGIKGKINQDGEILDEGVKQALATLIKALSDILSSD